MAGIVADATHVSGPLLVDGVSEGLLDSVPAGVYSQLTSKTLFEDYSTANRWMGFDQDELALSNTVASTWSRADIQGTLGTLQYRHSYGSNVNAGEINGGGLRFDCGAGTPEGLAIVRNVSTNVRGAGWVCDMDGIGGGAVSNMHVNGQAPITFLTCVNFDGAVGLQEAGLENDIFMGMVASGPNGASTTVPISSAGALPTNRLVGWHGVADVDTVPVGRAVGAAGTSVSMTEVNGGVPISCMAEGENAWFGFKIQGNDRAIFYYGNDPGKMRIVGHLRLPAGNTLIPSTSTGDFYPAFAWNQGDAADSDAYYFWLRKLLVHQPNVFVPRFTTAG